MLALTTLTQTPDLCQDTVTSSRSVWREPIKRNDWGRESMKRKKIHTYRVHQKKDNFKETRGNWRESCPTFCGKRKWNTVLWYPEIGLESCDTNFVQNHLLELYKVMDHSPKKVMNFFKQNLDPRPVAETHYTRTDPLNAGLFGWAQVS